jgi:FG-GAP-like repeat
LQGENTGLKTELRGISAAIFCILFISSSIAQVPINGFCRLKTIPAFPGYNRILISDMNYDSFKDIILYSPSQKSIAIIEGDIDSSFSNYKIVLSSFHNTKLLPVFNIETGSEQFVFSSRKSRNVGLFGFSSYGRINLVTEISFDSYPENISAADINNNGDEEYLVSGSGFNGLSLLSYVDGEFIESKIEINSTYGEAVFIDFSNDGFPDIVAFNLINNTFEIFYNDGLGNFERVRSELEKTSIENLHAVDFNNDGFDDLIYSSNNSINLSFGDPQSFYDSLLVIATEFFPHRFEIADFNGDGLNDIAYIDSTEGTLSLIFAKSYNQFYPEIVYLKKEGITDLHLFRSENSNCIAVLNKKGEIYIVSKLNSLPDEVNIVPALQPSTLTTFDLRNDGITDFGYIDSKTNTINFIINNENGIPGYFYSTSVSADHSKIIVDDSNPLFKGFYCYSTDGKMLEIIDFDFAGDLSKSDQIYLPGSIKNLKIFRTDDLVHIFLAYKKNNVLRVREYEHHDFRYNRKDFPPVDTNIVSSTMILSHDPVIYYWKADGDSLFFIKAELNLKSVEYSLLGAISRDSRQPINSITQYLLDEKKPTMFSLIDSDTNYFSVVSDDSLFNISNHILKNSMFFSNEETKLNVEIKEEEILPFIVLYLPEEHSFIRVEIRDEGKEIFISKLFDLENVTDFFVQKIISDKTYLIYTQQSEGFISLKLLK